MQFIKQLFVAKTTDPEADKLEAVRLNPNQRVDSKTMTDQEKFTDATKYGTYQVNGLDVDF